MTFAGPEKGLAMSPGGASIAGASAVATEAVPMYGEAVADGAMGADLNAMIINCCCSPSSCISRFNRFLSFKVIRLAHWRLSLVRAAKSSSDSLLCGTITPSTFSEELMAVTYLLFC